MVAIHHPRGPVRQDDAVELAGVIAVDPVALPEVALEKAPAPLVAEPRVHLLQVHRAAGLGRVGGVHHADPRVFDGQAAQVARQVDGVVNRAAGPFGLLGAEPEEVAQGQAGHHAQDKAGNQQTDAFRHGTLPDAEQ